MNIYKYSCPALHIILCFKYRLYGTCTDVLLKGKAQFVNLCVVTLCTCNLQLLSSVSITIFSSSTLTF